ncbi:DeoR/GlpR family DNA-binding transcription regulator [Rothia sp. LK2588]|uniref:DeoR/GlpR family DNA-binding transcription regulator n=1 Tax=Rothia sp. LK2588 TaxID=3114369 RepID=UPI0034CEACD2
MFPADRHRRILEEITSRGTALTTELAESLSVSDMTIRRDLNELHEQGLLIKVHGGATSLSNTLEPVFDVKAQQYVEEKNSIAHRAVEYVRAEQTVGFSAGSTCVLIAQQIMHVPSLTVVTNSLQVANVFYASESDATVLLTGGVRTPSDALVGPLADNNLKNLHIDTLFIGAHGADPRQGLMTPNLQEAQTNQKLIEASRQRIAVFDGSKWSVTGLATFASFQEIDVVITSKATDNEMQHIDWDALPSRVVMA